MLRVSGARMPVLVRARARVVLPASVPGLHRIPRLALTLQLHMRVVHLLCAAAVVAGALPGAALADPNDLTGGVLIQHFDPRYLPSPGYAPPAGDWCAVYDLYPIQSLPEVNAQLDPGYVVWFIVAAWEGEDRTWCGVEFGFGAYSASLADLTGWGPCFPATGLEIPTPGWPGPNEGTAFVTTAAPWSGNWEPLYWFGGYAYDYTHGTTVIPIGVDPPTGFCGFCNCATPPMMFSVGLSQRGKLGINEPGYTPVWLEIQPWACCFRQPPYCRMLAELPCIQQGGAWMGGEPTTCDPDPCPHPGACCIIGNCSMMFEANCVLVGGQFMGQGTTCNPNPCPGACCIQMQTAPHQCELLSEGDCLAAGGFWHPHLGSCDPNPCEGYTPPGSVTWGRIKSMYR